MPKKAFKATPSHWVSELLHKGLQGMGPVPGVPTYRTTPALAELLAQQSTLSWAQPILDQPCGHALRRVEAQWSQRGTEPIEVLVSQQADPGWAFRLDVWLPWAAPAAGTAKMSEKSWALASRLMFRGELHPLASTPAQQQVLAGLLTPIKNRDWPVRIEARNGRIAMSYVRGLVPEPTSLAQEVGYAARLLALVVKESRASPNH